MDPELKQKYLDCGGTFCPFCGSHMIQFVSDYRSEYGEDEPGTVVRPMMCDTCSEEWEEYYELKEARYVPGDDRANA